MTTAGPPIEPPEAVYDLAATPLAKEASLGFLEAPMGDDAREFFRASRAPATRRAYRGDWERFEHWCGYGKFTPLPAEPGTVADYISHLAKAGKRVSTITRALAAISFVHRLAGRPLERRHPVIAGVLGGISRELGVEPSKKRALEDTLLKRVLEVVSGKTKRGMRDRAILLVGWFSGCRRSELAALEVSDVRFVEEGVEIKIRRSKTDQEGRGLTKGIPYAGAPDLCPVRTLKRYLDATEITDGPLFRDVRAGTVRGGINAQTVARTVKRACRAAGIDETEFGGHSLRAGFVTTAFKRGKSMEAIARHTGHKSMGVLRGYVRHATLFVDNAATGLL